MHRFMALYPPQEDPAHFRTYYEQTHIPLARKMPGVKNVAYGFDIAAMNDGGPWECVFTCDFDSVEAMAEAMTSPEGMATAADTANFASPPPMLFHFPLAGES